MIQARGFSGKLNQDDSPFRLPAGDYTDALNITRDAQGAGNDEIITNEPGNIEVNYSFSAGTNKVIGNYADKVRNRQYIFVWNSNNFHEITYYDANLNTIVKVIKNLTDTGGVNVLNFDPSWKINHIDIIYRDEEGDLLYWTDGLNPPRKINVKTAILGSYGVIISSYLDVAKEPPSAPPYCVYENDATVTVNNLNNKQFKFKYRFVFDDLEKSVTSAQSEIPIPWEYTLPIIYTDPTKNSNIFIVFETGAENVTKIELLASQSQGTTWSDYFLIQTIDKTELVLNSNDVAAFRFYNDQAYNIIPIKESIQPFDLVPLKAYTQSLPNGNVLDYGAITEGYDLVESDYETTLLSSLPATENSNYLLAVAYQGEQPAFGSGDIKIIIGGNPQPGDVISVYVLVNNVPYTITATAANPETISGMITKLSASAVLGGFTVVSTSSNNLVISQADSTIVRVLVDYAPYVPQTVDGKSIFAYDWSSKYAYGVVYFDEKGRTNGVVTSLPCAFQTKSYTEVYDSTYQRYIPDLPYQQFKIESRPPIWANYFQIVRTSNLTKSNFLYWVSDRTYKDNKQNLLGYQYAYISITTLTDAIIENKELQTLGYEFTVGDRIRFVKRINPNATTANVYTNKDFQILESITNPTINGTVVTGQLLKINLPATDSNFDFGGNAYANYFIEIYTPALNYSNELNLYYEFGERYIIGDAGTVNAYHQGMTQNQSSNLITPALYRFVKGDAYFRFRNIPFGGNMVWGMATGNILIGTLGGTLTKNTNNSTDYSAFSNITPSPSYCQFMTIIDTTKVYSFLITGTIKFTPSANIPPGSAFIKFASAPNLLPPTNEVTFNFGQLIANVEREFSYSLQLNTQVGDILVATVFNPGGFSADLLSWDIKVTENNRVLNQGIIDPNFSDTYDSSATPNGRAWKVEPNAAQLFNPALIRFGDEFQPGTTINNTNRFYEDNFDVYDRSKGSIKKMFIEGRNQYVFQQFDVGVVTILTQIVRDTAGNPLSAQSDKLLNKIVYPYQGGYGIGEFPESFAYGKNAKYFIDGNKGVVVRLAQNGMTPISIVYKMNAFFVPRIAKYKDAPNFIIKPTIYGAFDAYTNKYIIGMEEISTASTIYNSVEIGGQTWMTNNWDGTTYRNGDPIPEVTNNATWVGLTTGAWCYYNNDPANGDIYGKLYNWYAINDPRGFAPEGWDVPTINQINVLISYLGDSLIAGGEMKETGLLYWNSPNTGATNNSGWNGVGSGILSFGFNNLKESASYWSKSQFPSNPAGWGVTIYYDSSNANTGGLNYNYGLSVRLIKQPTIFIQDAKTIAFLETATNKEGFESFLSFLPENMGALNNQFFSFKAGQIWKHLTPDPISGTPAFCNFYNTQYSAEVQVVFNETPLMKKYFLSIMESANTAWECPAIVSQLDSYSGTPQLTAIVSARFKLLEGQYYSAIFRDINSKGGLINGAIMHGNYLIVRFKKDQASSFVYLNAVSLNYKESPLNLR